MRVLINGFGRIGRTLLRQILVDDRNSDINVVGINDIASLESCAYLFRYDSVFGPFPGTVQEGANSLVVDGLTLPFTQQADVSALDLQGVDLMLECTGKAKTREVAERGLQAGAKAILISGPSDAADLTAVLGANESDIADAQIVSNASCTTNAIAPLLKPLDEALGIARAHITTIHCYTGSQPTVDAPAASLERSRAAAVSMVPTSTSAASQVARVLPSMTDTLTVSAVRVPCISVSAIDAVIQFEKPIHAITDQLRDLFAGSALVGVTDDPCVSTDMRTRSESLVLAMPETRQVGNHQVRLFGWYDNEWGFSARMIDMARLMVARD